MLTSETKQRISSLRQILVGKVPNPTEQVDQITNALIYKYMDDMDQQAISLGGKAGFFVGKYEKYAWKNLMDTKIGAQDRMNVYTEALESMGTNKNLSPVFRDILKGAFLPYRSPETLNLFLHEIDSFSYSHSEELGNAFEYLLSIMGSQGDAGMFRTPRHIINFIVKVVNPTKDDTVLDPACGTAGFLISAYKHIKGEHDGIDNKTGKKTDKEKTLTPAQVKKIHKNFSGYDISPSMTKLSRANMFLHQFPDPQIYEYDTLSSEERWNDNFDVILANPPFMSPKGGIVPHSRFSIKANRSEVLFVDYILEHLKPKGRAGIIVPEGVVFQSGNAYKQLRKALVEDGLWAVVSLPQGVFNPYAGVKTSILLFDNNVTKQSDEVLFVKIENDGFDLGAQRRSIEQNDLPKALELMNKYKESLNNKDVYLTRRDVTENGILIVSKKEIFENDDYNLSIDRYKKDPLEYLKNIVNIKEKEIQKSLQPVLDSVSSFVKSSAFLQIQDNFKKMVEQYQKILEDGKIKKIMEIQKKIIKEIKERQKWPMVELGDVATLMTGGTPKSTKEEYYGGDVKWLVSGDIHKGEVFDCDGRITNLALRESNTKLLPINSVLIALNGQGKTRGSVAILRVKAACNQSLVSIEPQKEKLLPEFLLYALRNMYQEIRGMTGDNQRSGLNMPIIRSIKIPLPPLEIQKQIVAEIDGYQKVIDGAKQVVENWKPNIKNDPDWKVVKLEKVCKYAGGTQPPKSTFIYESKDDYIRLLQIRDYKNDNNIVYIPKKERHKMCTEQDIMIGRYGPPVFQILKGKAGAYNVALMKCLPDESKITNDWLYYFLLSERVQTKIIALSERVRQAGVRPADLDNLDVALPTLDVQVQVVDKIKEEQKMVDQNKKLIGIFEQKIKQKISEVWGK